MEEAERTLRECVAVEEKVLRQDDASSEARRSSCFRILDAVDHFLCDWEDTCGESTTLRLAFPNEHLRKIFSLVVQASGPGSPYLRRRLWKILQSTVTTQECRQCVLDFLPATFPLRYNEQLEKELFQTLKQVFGDDTNSATQVLECLSQLNALGKVQTRNFFRFATDMLPKVPDEHFHKAVRILVEQIGDDSDASRAVEAVRSELGYECTASHETTIATARELHTLTESTGHELFFATYLSQTSRSVRSLHTPDTLDVNEYVEEKGSVNVFDLLVMLLLSSDRNHSDQVQATLEALMEEGMIGSNLLNALIDAVGGPDGIPESLQEDQFFHDIIPSLQWLATFLLLLPLRLEEYDILRSSLEPSTEFCIKLASLLKGKYQEELVCTLLRIDGELIQGLQKAPTRSARLGGILPRGNACSAVPAVSSAILEILAAIAQDFPQLSSRYSHVICERLRAAPTHALERHSKLISHLDRNNCEGQSGEELSFICSSPLLACHSLLFSASKDGNAADPNQNIKECIRGLAIASEMLSADHQSSNTIDAALQWVRMLLLPPHSHMVNPEVGLHCLKALLACLGWDLTNTGPEVLTPLSNEVIQAITHALTATRLVQYEDTKKNKRARDNVVVGYTGWPGWLDLIKQPKRARAMVFSFEGLLTEPSMGSPDKWVQTSKWIFELVNTYLLLGRKSKTSSSRSWTPNSWVQAIFRFPDMDWPSLNGLTPRQHRVMELLKRVVGIVDVSGSQLNDAADVTKKDYVDAARSLKRRKSFTIQFATGLQHCSLAFLLALGVSAAVLNNTFLHYGVAVIDQDSETPNLDGIEGTAMLQFQLMKIYDLETRCRVLERFMRGIPSSKKKMRRQPKRSKATVNSRNVPTACEEMNLIRSAFVESTAYVPAEVLWTCLVDPKHDSIVVAFADEHSKSLGVASAVNSAAVAVVNLKMNIVAHLTAHLLPYTKLDPRHASLAITQSVQKELEQLLPRFAQCLRLSTFLSRCCGGDTSVQGGSDGKYCQDKLRSLTAALFRLLFVGMVLTLEARETLSSGSDHKCRYWMKYADFLNIYRSILRAGSPLTEAIDVQTEKSPCFESGVHPILKHLQKSDNAWIVTDLLETLSVLALYSTDSEAIPCMVNVYQKSLHSALPSGDVHHTPRVPYAFAASLRRMISSPDLTFANGNSSDSAVRGTIAKMAFRQTKALQRESFLVYNMLSLWAFLVLSKERRPILFGDNLGQLSENLKTFLDAVVEQSRKPRLTKRKRQPSSDDDEDEYVPAEEEEEAVHIFPNSSGPGISSRSYAVYFHVLLNMTVAAASIVRLQQGTSWVKPAAGPYKSLDDIIGVFGSLIHLYVSKRHVFPYKVFVDVLNASRTMLSVTLNQVQGCVDWRSLQPTLSGVQLEMGAVDPASIHHLVATVNGCKADVIGKLASLCNSVHDVRSSTNGSTTMIAQPWAGQEGKVKSLRAKLDRVSKALESVTAGQGHSQPMAKRQCGRTLSMSGLKRRRIEFESHQQAVESEENGSEEGGEVGMDRAEDIREGRDDVGQLSSEAGSDEFTIVDSSDGSFGVTGDWGHESDSDIEM